MVSKAPSGNPIDHVEQSTSAPSAQLPISPDLMHDEMVSVYKVLGKHIQRLNAGLPGIDTPGDAEEAAVQLDAVLKEMIGELYLCASKLESLARVLNGNVE